MLQKINDTDLQIDSSWEQAIKNKIFLQQQNLKIQVAWDQSEQNPQGIQKIINKNTYGHQQDYSQG